MTTIRVGTSIFFAMGITVALMEMGCSLETVPADRRRQNEAPRDAFEREIQETSAASDHLRAQERQRMVADPGSPSIEQSVYARAHTETDKQNIEQHHPPNEVPGIAAAFVLIAAGVVASIPRRAIESKRRI